MVNTRGYTLRLGFRAFVTLDCMTACAQVLVAQVHRVPCASLKGSASVLDASDVPNSVLNMERAFPTVKMYVLDEAELPILKKFESQERLTAIQIIQIAGES